MIPNKLYLTEVDIPHDGGHPVQSFVTDDGVHVDIIRSPRRKKTLSLRVSNGQVKVNAPATTPLSVIRAFVEQKRGWIAHALTLMNQSQPAQTAWYEWPWAWLGEPLQIAFYAAKGWRIHLNDGTLVVTGPGQALTDPVVQHAVTEWFRTNAAELIGSRVAYWSNIIGTHARAVRIREQKTRWGSCSGRGNLNFNWRLIMAPLWVLDYVVVHELCHLLELNHSPRFWNLVASAYPGYLEAKQWLKANGSRLFHQSGQ